MNYFENKKALYTVRITGFTDEYREMLRRFLSEDFTVCDGDAHILICEDGKGAKNHPREKTIVIGEAKKHSATKHMVLSRPVDLATLRAVALSMAESEAEMSTEGEYVPDPVNRTVSYRGKSVRLTTHEFRLFMLLNSRMGETVSREDIQKTLHSTSEKSNMADVYACYLRKKLESIAGQGALISVRGKGYLLANPK